MGMDTQSSQENGHHGPSGPASHPSHAVRAPRSRAGIRGTWFPALSPPGWRWSGRAILHYGECIL